MKDFIKKKLNENIAYNLIETLMGEEYPSTFDMEHFKTLTNFNQRIKYCNEHLTKISSLQIHPASLKRIS